MVNYIDQIEELRRNHVYIRDKDKVNELIHKIATGGVNNLQIVSDFDRTITKQHKYGKESHSSVALFGKCPSVTERFLRKNKEYTEKFGKIEIDPTIPIESKIKHMEEWWIKTEYELKGLKVSREELDNVVTNIGIELRDGCKALFELLNKHNVPVLVFSAGLGDAVEAVLKHYNILYDDVKIVANFLKYDENGVIRGYLNEKFIHIFNKNESTLKNTKYYKVVRDRKHVILMGDSLGDAGMADDTSTVKDILKIGFLYSSQEHREENLQLYQKFFDIVLEDDQTMDVINAILKHVLKS